MCRSLLACHHTHRHHSPQPTDGNCISIMSNPYISYIKIQTPAYQSQVFSNPHTSKSKPPHIRTALECVPEQGRRQVSQRGRIYVALTLSILLHRCETWFEREEEHHLLRRFHKACVRAMCRVSMFQVRRHRIRTSKLLAAGGICSAAA